MSIGNTTEKLLGHGHGHGLGHGHGHDHDHDRDRDHDRDIRLHPSGDGFVPPKAKHHGWLGPDPAPWRGIRG